MSLTHPAPLRPGIKVHVRVAGSDQSENSENLDGELLGFGESPSPYVLILTSGADEVVVFTGPGVWMTAGTLP